jgi:hypothetical protein
MLQSARLALFVVLGGLMATPPVFAAGPQEQAPDVCSSDFEKQVLADLDRYNRGPESEGLMATPDPTCKTDPKDPFEVGYRIQRGPNRGACVDTSRRRFARILDEKEARRYGSSSKHLFVANFRHDGKFWVAKIPRDIQFEDFLAEKVYYEKGQSHIQMRLIAKNGSAITLYPQSESHESKPRKVHDIMWSASSAHLQGQADQSPTGSLLWGNTAAVNTLMSTVQSRSEEPGRSVRHRRIHADDETRRKIFMAAVLASDHEEFKYRILLLSRNCINGFFRVIDSALGRDDYSASKVRGLNRDGPSIPFMLEGEVEKRGFKTQCLQETPADPEAAAAARHSCEYNAQLQRKKALDAPESGAGSVRPHGAAGAAPSKSAR